MLYATTRRYALGWAPDRLAVALGLMLRQSVQDEGSWGVIDALTDLVGGIVC